MAASADQITLGKCCVCEKAGPSVRNIVMLNLRLPPSHRSRIGGWGCFQCGLPMEGATAVLCDQCLENYTRDPAAHPINARLAVGELTEKFEHDLSKHPETTDG